MMAMRALRSVFSLSTFHFSFKLSPRFIGLFSILLPMDIVFLINQAEKFYPNPSCYLEPPDHLPSNLLLLLSFSPTQSSSTLFIALFLSWVGQESLLTLFHCLPPARFEISSSSLTTLPPQVIWSPLDPRVSQSFLISY